MSSNKVGNLYTPFMHYRMTNPEESWQGGKLHPLNF